ncbi:hypothetical protein RND81_07G086900 [Saponaria officinalis]|uniref:Uncharacterized protein n=1 Tax=Saponaria officinalis TaxID=3572 RepID=A0AAW1JT71_SAPOF
MMNLRKTLHSQIPNQLNPIFLHYFSTKFSSNQQQFNPQFHNDQNNQTDVRKIKTLANFSQIPYQSKVANWVNLIGSIKIPIKFLTCVHGNSWAGTLISHEQFSSDFPLCTPVIFQGDLAYTAMMHLKENDMVYVGGHLSPEPLPINLTDNKTNVQVLVHDVYFVRGLTGMKKKISQTLKESS